MEIWGGCGEHRDEEFPTKVDLEFAYYKALPFGNPVGTPIREGGGSSIA
jgi:hypothetical protein